MVGFDFEWLEVFVLDSWSFGVNLVIDSCIGFIICSVVFVLWWYVFCDDILNMLIVEVYCQNVDLQVVGVWVYQVCVQFGIVKGELFL